MNNINRLILTFIFGLLIVSCSKTDPPVTPLRDHAEQFAKDNDSIVKFLQTHYMEVTNNPGFSDDMDVKFTKIPAGGTQVSVWNQTQYPLQTLEVDQHNITYKFYYLKLREGVGESPSNVDAVYAGYRGILTNGTVFDQADNPQTVFNLDNLVQGWSEVMPKFKSGTYTTNNDGTLSYSNFGAGVMFLPSGLGYFSGSQGLIPSYSPLIFSFKLYEIKRLDHDNDGILSYLEDINGDGYLRVLAEGKINPDDTDGDRIPDYLDVDDDDDKVMTRVEIKNPATGIAFPFAQIPTCGGTGNGKKKHLDPSCN